MRRHSILVVLILGVITSALILSGCGEIQQMKRSQRVLDDLVKTNASESLVWESLPMKWQVYERGTERGDQFGSSLSRAAPSDAKAITANWAKADRALFHTTESVVTIVFVKSNVVFNYYIGSQ